MRKQSKIIFMQELYWGLQQCLRGRHCRGQEDPEGFYSEL